MSLNKLNTMPLNDVSISQRVFSKKDISTHICSVITCWCKQDNTSGETWKLSRCVTCSCFNGEVKCSTESCAQLTCPHRYKPSRSPSHCCPSCVESDGNCMLVGSQLHTFDEKIYAVHTNCNYVLTRDCQRRKFSVHVVNENKVQFSSLNATNHNAVVVKVENTKVTLSSNFVRIGRKTVQLPFIKLGVLSVVKDGNKLIVRGNIGELYQISLKLFIMIIMNNLGYNVTFISTLYDTNLRLLLGIKVVWSRNESLQVYVNPEYKSKVCGLCGNYNENTEDDWQTKKGELTNNYQRFINSWKVRYVTVLSHLGGSILQVGKANICSDDLKSTANDNRVKTKCKTREKSYAAINACDVLKSSTFHECRKIVRVMPYFRSCYAEMCVQENYCNTISSYISECRNAGVHIEVTMPSLLKCNTSKQLKKSNCPTGAVYNQCVSVCRKTCKNFRRNRSCQKNCKPGCACPSGTVLYGNRCIRPRHCPLPIKASVSIALNSTNSNHTKLHQLHSSP
ncbi:BMP-binding endothelial regulator protein-like protein [Leptotrombidium deliense]|uniref:BMP-binding endothelial regulator protein-like protein n=1 Tax=Leptotrombidium deliense TaxID=299467 RepID=A0A443SJM4_9ACAR|nr:BMP-binding endothelial regulator protein-like protein [Leptotrombidium deliense]